MTRYEFFLTHSLEKVFPDKRPACWKENQELGGFQNEIVSFQLVYSTDGEERGIPLQKFKIKVNGIPARLRKVDLVPSDFPCYGSYDANYLTTTPGMFPDVLTPFDGMITPICGQMRSAWIDVDLNSLSAGAHQFTVSAEAEKSLQLANGTEYVAPNVTAQNWKQTLTLNVYPASLPPQKILHTEWFHADCLADYYQVQVFGEEHWNIIENFIRFAG